MGKQKNSRAGKPAGKMQSLGKRLVSTGAGVLLGNFSGFVIGLVTIIVVARLLGPSGYGTYTIAVSYYLLIDAASSYGFGQFLNKHLIQYSDNKKKLLETASSGLILSLAFGVLTMGIGLGVGFVIASAYAKAGITFFSLALASLVILFAVPFGSMTGALIGLGKAKLMAIATIIENSVQLVAGILLIILGYGANGAVAGIVLGYLCGFVYGAYAIFKFFGFGNFLKALPSKSSLSYAFRFSMPLAITNIMGSSVTQFSALLLGIYVTSALVGNYGIATRSTFALNALYATFYLTLLSGFSFVIANDRKHVARAYSSLMLYSLVVSLPFLVFIAALSKPIVFLLFSSRYAYAPLYLSLIALGAVILILGKFASSLLVAGNETGKVMLYSAISVVAQLAFLLVLVPVFKVIGAIIAIFFLGSIVYTAIFLFGVSRLISARFNGMLVLKAFLANTILGLVLLFGNLIGSNAIALVYGVLVLILLYPPLLGFLGVLKKENLKELRRSFSGYAHAGAANKLIDYIAKFVRA
ncbi:MAG: oligosaccharide flippase family protein [Candidatus Micrarchaeia archaeon]